MAFTNPMVAVTAAGLMALIPVTVRTLGWLLGLRMVLKASRPDERPALLTAFAPVSAALQSFGQKTNRPEAYHSQSPPPEERSATRRPSEESSRIRPVKTT